MIVIRIDYSSIFSILFCLLFLNFSFSQEENNHKQALTFNKTFNEQVRGKNAVSMAIGTSFPNGDYSDALFEIYTHIGYKRYIGPFINLNITYHKYNIAFKDVLNEGFMSFDANLEITPLPRRIFTPFIFAGGGLNASNYFKRTDMKLQGGAGFEILVAPLTGLKLFAEYNLTNTDELDGRIYGEADDAFWRIGIGVNFYFEKRRSKNKIKKGEPTVINSNPIFPLKTK